MEKFKPYLTINVIWPLVFAAGFAFTFLKYSILSISTYSSSSRGLAIMIGLLLLFGLLAFVFFKIAMTNKKAD